MLRLDYYWKTLTMNRLSRRLLAVGVAGALSLGIIGVAQAQNEPTPAPRTREARKGPDGARKHRMHRTQRTVDLNLTAEQKDQLKALREESKQQRDAIMQNTGLAEADKKQQLAALRKDAREKLLAVLTPEQREKLEAHRKEMKTRREGMKGKRAPQ
jgi:Spy/CpxP family protein refolding chaperone